MLRVNVVKPTHTKKYNKKSINCQSIIYIKNIKISNVKSRFYLLVYEGVRLIEQYVNIFIYRVFKCASTFKMSLIPS